MSAPDAKDGTDLLAIAALRAALWQQGSRPVPLLSADDADPKKAGKAPIHRGWPDRARRNPPEAAVTPALAHLANTGILADGLRLVDVDDFGRAEAIEGHARKHLGAAPTPRRDNANRFAMLYRAAEGAPRKRTLIGTTGDDPKNPDRIEVLGRGQQFVAYGTHASGGILYWTGPEPKDISATSLPRITEDAITAFLADAAAIIQAPKPALRPPGKPPQSTGNGATNPAELANLADALAALPAELAKIIRSGSGSDAPSITQPVVPTPDVISGITGHSRARNTGPMRSPSAGPRSTPPQASRWRPGRFIIWRGSMAGHLRHWSRRETGRNSTRRYYRPMSTLSPGASRSTAANYVREIILAHLLRADASMFSTVQTVHARRIGGFIALCQDSEIQMRDIIQYYSPLRAPEHAPERNSIMEALVIAG